ncbi:MAG: Tm-1-like ATP-binding domain-containing protein [Variovorax sp.]
MSAAAPAAWVVGTFDTKADELNYMAGLLRAAGVAVVTVDIGTRSQAVADIPSRTVAQHHPGGAAAVLGATDRGVAVSAMGDALCVLVRERLAAGEIAGIIGAGGSGGSAMLAPAMRLLPIGRPKLLVSTMAAGNMAPYVDVVDMTSVYPVTDIAGLNRLSRTILANAAHAMAGMLLHAAPAVMPGDDRPAIGLTMFGVTTPCVLAVRALLGDSFDAQIFHANGPGGRTLESLAGAGMLQAVVDITTTEVGQHLAGGICDAGPNRLDAAARYGLPWIGSVGALDMINWGGVETIPSQHRGRRFHMHNANITLMRSTADELVAAGLRIAEQLNRSPGPVRLLLPMGGVSMLDAPGQPFHDPAADAALFDTLRRAFVASETHRLEIFPLHINDPVFADAIAHAVRDTVRAG